MLPFNVDPSWYEGYWYGERPPRRRRPMLRTLLRLAAGFAVAVASAARRRGRRDRPADATRLRTWGADHIGRNLT